MAIYNIFDFYEKVSSEKVFGASGPKIDPNAFKTNQIDENFIPSANPSKDHVFSAIAARLFFFLLLLLDLAWGVYSAVASFVKFSLCLLTLFQVSYFNQSLARSYLSLKRSVVCGLALLVALFSPALGIMFSCMYFLMYDKSGVDEIVPNSLRDQFKELFPTI